MPLGQLVVATIGLAAAIGSWWFLHEAELTPRMLPGPEKTLSTFAEMAFAGYRGSYLHEHLFTSLSRVLIGVTIAIVVSIPLALVIHFARVFAPLLYPPVLFIRALPPLGYYGILVLVLGIGDVSKVVLLFLAAAPPLVISILGGLRALPEGLVETVRLFGYKGWIFWWKFLLPAILPSLFTGLRIAFGFAMTTIVAAEIVASTSGIGWVILDASRYLQTDVVVVGVLTIGLLALLIDGVLFGVYRWISRGGASS